MPGHDLKKIQKALLLPADTVVLDLEDGVPHGAKGLARSVVSAFLQTFTRARGPAAAELSLRVNSLQSGVPCAERALS